MGKQAASVLCSVVSGLEKLASDDVEELLGIKGEKLPGSLMLRGVNHDQARIVMEKSRCIEKMFVVIAEVEYASENDLHSNSLAAIQAVLASDWLHFFSYWKYMGSSYPVRYRVTVKIRGKNKITEKTKFSQFLASALDTQFCKFKDDHTLFESIEDDLTSWNAEIVVHLRKTHLWIGINLTAKALWKLRSYQTKSISLGNTSLKPSISYAMITLLGVTEGIILEPMVGSGMIVMEMIDMGKFSGICLCGDNATIAIKKTRQNIAAQGKIPFHCGLLCWDATTLPLQDNSIDGIITDLPFGKRIANESKISWDYPNLFSEFFRVLKKKAKLVLLSSNYVYINRIIRSDRRWINQNQVRINHGGIECVIFVLAKRYIPHDE